ncbi:MAG: TraB/GumN family protein [Allosphingosinicella sp.]
MRKVAGAALIGAAMALAAVPAAAQQAPAGAASQEEQVEEILVTGRRSGAPMWRVTGPKTSIVLVGGIRGISKATKWDPDPLIEAMRGADRVMFPEARALTASPFSAIGWLAKWKAMSSLPKGQALVDFVEPGMLARLDALRTKGLAKKDFERRHPLHLAGDLRDDIEDELKFGPLLTETVMKAAKKHKMEIVPVPRSKAKPVVKDLFASSPAEHVPCLTASVGLAEVGSGAV